MFKGIKNKYRLYVRRQENKLAEVDLSIKQYERALSVMDQIESTTNTVVDEDLNSGWFLHGSGNSIMSEEDHSTMLSEAFKLYHKNTYARAIIRNLVKFVFGKGPSVISKDENEDNKKKSEKAWKEFRKDNKFNRREKEIGTRIFRDGECFLRFFENEEEGKLKIRFIRAQLIANPINKQDLPKSCTYGILTDPNDIEEVKSYYKCDSQGNQVEIIPAEQVEHIKIFADSDQKRGISVLKVAAPRLAQYESWLTDRIVLNKVRSAIALVRTVPGSVKNVKSIRDENLAGRRPANEQRLAMPDRGSIITASKGVEYAMLSPNIQASDVKDDGRAMLLSVAAGIGFPEMIFTADFSNANYASSLTAMNPFIREIEDWQDFITDLYERLFERVIDAKIKAGKISKDVSKECEVTFPPIIQADLEKLAKAFEILYKYRAISKKTWRGKMGLNDEQERLNIQNEDAEDGGVPGNIFGPGDGSSPSVPFSSNKINMPIAPINQYGHKIFDAIREGDWVSVKELADKIIELDEEENNR